MASEERRLHEDGDLAAPRGDGDDLSALRARLAARRWACWSRFEDAISELYALHDVQEEEILARARRAIERERADPMRQAAASDDQ